MSYRYNSFQIFDAKSDIFNGVAMFHQMISYFFFVRFVRRNKNEYDLKSERRRHIKREKKSFHHLPCFALPHDKHISYFPFLNLCSRVARNLNALRNSSLLVLRCRHRMLDDRKRKIFQYPAKYVNFYIYKKK